MSSIWSKFQRGILAVSSGCCCFLFISCVEIWRAVKWGLLRTIREVNSVQSQQCSPVSSPVTGVPWSPIVTTLLTSQHFPGFDSIYDQHQEDSAVFSFKLSPTVSHIDQFIQVLEWLTRSREGQRGEGKTNGPNFKSNSQKRENIFSKVFNL